MPGSSDAGYGGKRPFGYGKGRDREIVAFFVVSGIACRVRSRPCQAMPKAILAALTLDSLSSNA